MYDALQEELAGKRADASHFAKLATDQKDQLVGLKQSLDATSHQLHTAQSNLSQVCLFHYPINEANLHATRKQRVTVRSVCVCASFASHAYLVFEFVFLLWLRNCAHSEKHRKLDLAEHGATVLVWRLIQLAAI